MVVGTTFRMAVGIAADVVGVGVAMVVVVVVGVVGIDRDGLSHSAQTEHQLCKFRMV